MGSKITQKNIKVFCSGATGSIERFGTTKAGSPVYSDDPDVIKGFTGATGRTGLTGQNAWTLGWYAGLTGNNVPAFQSMNAFCYEMTRFLAFMNQEGIPKWNAGITYPLDGLSCDTDGNIYNSVVLGNINHALTEYSYWTPLWSTKTRSITTSTTLANDDFIVIWSAATAADNRTITLPSLHASQSNGREIFVFVSGDTTAGGVICGGETITRYQWRRYVATDAAWQAFFLK